MSSTSSTLSAPISTTAALSRFPSASSKSGIGQSPVVPSDGSTYRYSSQYALMFAYNLFVWLVMVWYRIGMKPAYYNEIDSYCVQWLRNLIAKGLIAPGVVDERPIQEVRPDDLAPYGQCHFFAGLGGWSYALRMAGIPDRYPIWTGSCPCQPFSLAGKQKGFDDARHLWPEFKRLIQERRPPVVFGEQVASASQWLGLVRSDLEAVDYAVGAMPIEAASAGADEPGDRFWFVAATDFVELRRQPSARQQPEHEQDTCSRFSNARGAFEWRCGADGKKRRVDPSIDWLAHGISARIPKLRALGNSIDWRPAAAFIQAAILACGDLNGLEPTK